MTPISQGDPTDDLSTGLAVVPNLFVSLVLIMLSFTSFLSIISVPTTWTLIQIYLAFFRTLLTQCVSPLMSKLSTD